MYCNVRSAVNETGDDNNDANAAVYPGSNVRLAPPSRLGVIQRAHVSRSLYQGPDLLPHSSSAPPHRVILSPLAPPIPATPSPSPSLTMVMDRYYASTAPEAVAFRHLRCVHACAAQFPRSLAC
jgi:hypothetical protein